PANFTGFAENMNITLNGEQINEVEKNPEQIIGNCVGRLDLKVEPGQLCDAFFSYLLNKCEKLDYLSNYCGGILLYKNKKILYEQEKNTQKSCLLNPPLPNDREGIEKCMNYINFNSTYYNLPPKVSITSMGATEESNQGLNNVNQNNSTVMFKLSLNV